MVKPGLHLYHFTLKLQESCAAVVQSDLSPPSHSKLFLWAPDTTKINLWKPDTTKINLWDPDATKVNNSTGHYRWTDLVVQLGEPVMQ